MGEIELNCELHPSEEAIAVCVTCHTPLCEECIVKIDGRNYCQSCANEIKAENPIDNFTNKIDSFVKEKGLDEKFTEVKGTVGDELSKIAKQGAKETSSLSEKIKDYRQGSKSPIEKIKEAKELLDMGAITEEEFEQIKQKNLKKI